MDCFSVPCKHVVAKMSFNKRLVFIEEDKIIIHKNDTCVTTYLVDKKEFYK